MSRGRLGNCVAVSSEVNNPIVVSPKSHLTELIVWDCHFQCNHLGVNSTLNRIRSSGFWLVRGRRTVSSVLNNCFICRKFNSRSFDYPIETDLPGDRVNLIVPYKVCGIDFTGNFSIKLNGVLSKMYILIFTCYSIRSIHLEILPDMSNKSFLQAFSTFCNCYSVPSIVYSDNANTFLSSLSILNKASLDSDWTDFLASNNIKHKTIPLYSAWFGSAYERLIGVVKSCIYKTIGRRQIILNLSLY